MEVEFHQLDLRYESLRARNLDRERHLLVSLEEHGQQTPVVLVAHSDEEGRYVVIDGGKRIRALKRLQQDTVEVLVWDLSEAEALVLKRSLGSRPKESALEQGWLLAELRRSFGWNQEELARRFSRSSSWVSDRLGLAQVLPVPVQEQIRQGRIPAQAAVKCLVPLARRDTGAVRDSRPTADSSPSDPSRKGDPRC